MQVLLLENTRFHKGDEGNDPEFAKALAHGADAFVNDAFGVCHRNQGSVSAVCCHVATSYMGLLVKAELESMVSALDNPKRWVHNFATIEHFAFAVCTNTSCKCT